MIAEAIRRVVDGEDLSAELMSAAMSEILGGQATSAQIAALLVALRMKGEKASEIAAAARVMRAHSASVQPKVSGSLVDTCGTGGDGLHTFNISTAASVVVAACGVSIAKHGNRAVSSKAGSADVLSALGVQIDQSPEQVSRCIEEIGIGFLFAPKHHQAMKHAAPVRKELGLRTLFNLLGPLSNPASASHQVLGVYDPALIVPLAEALRELGVQGAWVVHGSGGMDEVTPFGETAVAVLQDGRVSSRIVTPADFGLDSVSPESLKGDDASTNADMIRDLLAGERGGPRAAVIINAAAALVVSEMASDPEQGATQAAAAIDSGAAARKLAQWVAWTNR